MINNVTNSSGAKEAQAPTDLDDDALVVLTMPVKGVDDASNNLEVIRKQNLQIYRHQYQERTLLLQQQTELLASRETVLNRNKRCLGSGEVVEMATSGWNAHGGTEGVASANSMTYRTPARNLMIATGELDGI